MLTAQVQLKYNFIFTQVILFKLTFLIAQAPTRPFHRFLPPPHLSSMLVWISRSLQVSLILLLWKARVTPRKRSTRWVLHTCILRPTIQLKRFKGMGEKIQKGQWPRFQYVWFQPLLQITSNMHYIHYVLCTTKSKWNALISGDKQAHQEINASANFINRSDVKHVHCEPSGLGS